MRIESKLSQSHPFLVAHDSVGREVKSVSGVHALKPSIVHAYQSQEDANHRQHQAGNDEDRPASARYGMERRKQCRRVRQQRLLIELRSGGDRRHALAEDAHFGHVDEEV